MKKTIFLAVAALTVSAAVNAQTDTTKRDTTGTGTTDTLHRDSTQAHAFIKKFTGATTAQVNVLNGLKAATSDMLKPRDY